MLFCSLKKLIKRKFTKLCVNIFPSTEWIRFYKINHLQ